MSNLETIDPQTQTDSPMPADPLKDASANTDASVDTSASNSDESSEGDSLLGQDPVEEDSLENPLTDETKEEDTIEKNEVNFDEITLPEGFVMDETFKPLASDLNLSQEQTQKLIDYKIEADKQAAGIAQSEFKAVVENLQKETKEMLGVDYKKEMSYAARAMNLISKEEQSELKQVLNVSGIGNHPMLVKMFIATGKAISEAKFVDGKQTNNSKPVSPALGLAQGLMQNKEN